MNDPAAVHHDQTVAEVAACCIECVTIKVVSLSLAMNCSLTAITWSALFGSSAAVCSSSSSSCGRQPGRHEQGQGLPLAAGEGADGVVEAVFEAHVQAADAIADVAHGGRAAAPSRGPRRRPRRAARARFSAIDMFGGRAAERVLKHAADQRARRCSGQ